MPTRSRSRTRGRTKSGGARAARTRAAARTPRAKDPVTLKNIGKAAAVAAGLITTGLLLKRKG